MAKEFFITAPRYLQQVGDAEPQFISASPGAPVKVLLPDDHVKSKHDHHLHAAEPEKMKPAHAPSIGAPVKKASDEAKGKADAKQVRASDK